MVVVHKYVTSFGTLLNQFADDEWKAMPEEEKKRGLETGEYEIIVS